MLKETNKLLHRLESEAGWQFGLVTEKNLEQVSRGLTSFKKQLAVSAFKDQDLPCDAIYFAGDNPFIQFKQLSTFNSKTVADIHRKIWNEGRTPLLAIITPQEIRLYDGFDIPTKEENSLQKLERGRFQNTDEDLKKLGFLLHQSKIDSGLIWKEEFGKSLKTQNRVDRKLVANLAAARKELNEKFNWSFDVIHDLLGRSLFTLYLEDREILKPENYPSKPKDVSNFFDLLEHPISTYKLFHQLKNKFNGDLFPVTTQEEALVNSNPLCLKVIKNCFSGDIDIRTNQLSLNWRMFQFQYIPIALISSIYEEFMSEEDEDHEKIKKDGAFYTPQMLVEFVLNEVLPWPDENNKRYDLKILDPACGSGIFLVESYKRLIARWKYSNKGKKIDEKILEDLLLNNIYGIEKNSEAIKVTAFSLYLTFLHYLEPRKVLSQVRFKPLVLWNNKKELAQREGKKTGNNLFQHSTFSKELDLTKYQFDLIIGNPPWKLGKLDNDVKSYLTKNKLPQQIMCAYLDYMPKLTLHGTIALVSAAKILFNTGSVYEKFRHRFFTTNTVDAIINLSVVRDIIFKNAKSPGAVIIYKARKTEEIDTNIITYCIPKNSQIIKHQQSLIIDASEIKFLPLREIIKPKSRIFKIAMWGNVRDLKLIERFNEIKTLKKAIPSINCATALHKAESKSGNLHLKNNLFFATEDIKQYCVDQKGLKPLNEHHSYFRPINKDIFTAPLVVIKEGTENGNICAAYVNFDCAYKAASLGIKLRGKSQNYHKALAAILNSSFSHYFIFMTSSSWGIDKAGRNQNNAILELPSIIFNMSETTVNNIASKVDTIISLKTNQTIEPLLKETIEQIKDDIDQLIYKELKISPTEESIIKDALSYSIALSKRYSAAKAEYPTRFEGDIKPYAKILSKTINNVMRRINKAVSVEIFTGSNPTNELEVIAIHFDKRESENTIITSYLENYTQLIANINTHIYNEHSESIHYRKVVKYYTGNMLYILKPNQRRFWSKSQALNDADSILLELIKN
ncbi:MAG: endonuclease [Bacteroidetes bacterium]|nr:endonuclease [Bacteroidota bacterium]